MSFDERWAVGLGSDLPPSDPGGCQEGRRRGIVSAFERRRPSLVVADDEPDVRERLTRVFSHFYEILASVANGYSLVQAASDLHFAALVTDLSMPMLTGFETLEMLNQGGAAVPTVRKEFPSRVGRRDAMREKTRMNA